MTFAFIRIYTLSVEHYSYAKYKATIRCTHKGVSEGIVWETTARLRRDVKALGEEALSNFRRMAMQAAQNDGLVNAPPMPRISRFQDRRGLMQGMFGREHTAETKAKIGAAIKARHAEGAFKKVRKGRLTNSERAERDARLAEAAGLTVAQYQRRLKLTTELRDKARAEFKAKHYITEEAARKRQRHQINQLK